jgi:predicted Zn-dependent protease
MMAETLNDTFDNAIKSYQDGESIDKLIPVFQDICAQAPKMNSAWTCLAWLYLLDKQPENAVKAAEKSIKIDPYDAQARVNLAMALLEAKQKGVREHVEVAQQLMANTSEMREQVESSWADGLQRNPDWASLQQVKSWITV